MIHHCIHTSTKYIKFQKIKNVNDIPINKLFSPISNDQVGQQRKNAF